MNLALENVNIIGRYDSSELGGLCGANGGTISNCYATGNVTGGNWTEYLGGLVGAGPGSRVTYSFWDVNTSGLYVSGGGVGLTTTEMQMQSTFTDAGWDFVDETVNGTEDIWDICENVDYPRLWWQDIQCSIEAHLRILPRQINRNVRNKRIIAWLHLTEDITKDQIDSNEPLLLYPGEIEAAKQYVFQSRRLRHRGVNILAFFDKAELLDAVSDNCKAELEVTGLLKSGQPFYRTDKVWIKQQR